MKKPVSHVNSSYFERDSEFNPGSAGYKGRPSGENFISQIE